MKKFEKRLAGWKSNILPMGGRVIMLKVVLACLPVYYLSLFQIPKTIKEDLDKIQRRFLWGGSSSNKKLHWVDWKSVCNLKELGGLGLIDLNLKNRALLNKWIWRFSEEPKALWSSIICSKYGGNQSSLIPCVDN